MNVLVVKRYYYIAKYGYKVYCIRPKQVPGFWSSVGFKIRAVTRFLLLFFSAILFFWQQGNT